MTLTETVKLIAHRTERYEATRSRCDRIETTYYTLNDADRAAYGGACVAEAYERMIKAKRKLVSAQALIPFSFNLKAGG